MQMQFAPLLERIKSQERLMNSLSSRVFRAQSRVDEASGRVELLFHGYVGDEYEQMDSASVAAYLARHRDMPVYVRMNSDGGLVFDGLAIYEALRSHPKPVSGRIEALAGSAMTIIAHGVDRGRLEIVSNGLFMVHRAWGMSIGNQHAMRGTAEVLAAIDEGIVETYAARTGQSAETINGLLDGTVDGTWLRPARALELGFVDRVVPLDAEPTEPPEPPAPAEPAGTPAAAAAAARLEAIRLAELAAAGTVAPAAEHSPTADEAAEKQRAAIAARLDVRLRELEL